MSSAARKRQDVEASLGGLSLSPSSHKTPLKPRSKPAQSIADSWEEEASSSSSSSDTETGTETPPSQQYAIPTAPPPTPISPTSPTDWASFGSPYTIPSASASLPRNTPSPNQQQQQQRRPEKSTAVAGRLIAGALGVRAPKKTEEQRAYEKAVKERETKRIQKEKEAKRREEDEKEKAKLAVWDG
ncbi:hypothetical protein MMC08_002588 [Hypocenomyce scalaris]|nr:hypothetical protein [Hypocenomyce scalaris]